MKFLQCTLQDINFYKQQLLTLKDYTFNIRQLIQLYESMQLDFSDITDLLNDIVCNSACYAFTGHLVVSREVSQQYCFTETTSMLSNLALLFLRDEIAIRENGTIRLIHNTSHTCAEQIMNSRKLIAGDTGGFNVKGIYCYEDTNPFYADAFGDSYISTDYTGEYLRIICNLFTPKPIGEIVILKDSIPLSEDACKLQAPITSAPITYKELAKKYCISCDNDNFVTESNWKDFILDFYAYRPTPYIEETHT